MCFPQFGPWELGPQHGFARDSDKWKVEGSGVSVDAVTGDASVSCAQLDQPSIRLNISKYLLGLQSTSRFLL